MARTVIMVSKPHNRNTLVSMLVTLLGMVTDCKDWQLLNAEPPMLVTLLGMVTDCKE